jgi:hypothetical protein
MSVEGIPSNINSQLECLTLKEGRAEKRMIEREEEVKRDEGKIRRKRRERGERSQQSAALTSVCAAVRVLSSALYHAYTLA